jgi:hypothetical protein
LRGAWKLAHIVEEGDEELDLFEEQANFRVECRVNGGACFEYVAQLGNEPSARSRLSWRGIVIGKLHVSAAFYATALPTGL